MPFAASRSMSTGVKCNEAVGEATAPSFFRENGLVIGRIGGVIALAQVCAPPDIGRQGHRADQRDGFIEIGASAIEAEVTIPLRLTTTRPTASHEETAPRAEDDAITRFQALSAWESLPGGIVEPLQQQGLNAHAVSVTIPLAQQRAGMSAYHEKRGDRGLQQIRQVAEDAILEPALPTHEQFRTVSRGNRMQRNARFRQVVIEIGERQRRFARRFRRHGSGIRRE